MRTRDRSDIIMEYGTYMLAYMAGYIASLAELYYISGCVLVLEALYLYVHWVRESKSLVELRALFTLAWVGGQGIACLQLSSLQKKWSPITWLCFFLIYIGFGIGYEWKRDYKNEERIPLEKNQKQADRLFHCIVILMAASIVCFLFEAVTVGFIPLFSDKPHAYSYFHVSGVHYFTISCILIPAITILYVKVGSQISIGKKMLLLFANITAIAVPVLCVSRFQLLFGIGFAVVTYVAVNRKLKLRTLFILLLILIPVYVLLTIARNHDVAYLNGIFEMKNAKMPIFITQPYIYVANNFENFNCMVEQLTAHTYGLKMLFPVFALTGLKFIFPQLVSFPVFLTKPELTTLTMFYDSYYDFGIIGVFIFAILVGALARIVLKGMMKSRNPVACLFYGQIAIYLGLAFFTTWFSNATTWFWLIMTSIMYWYTGHSKKGKKEE